MNDLFQSFNTMCQLLVQVHFLVRSIERIEENEAEIDYYIQLDEFFSHFPTALTVSTYLMHYAVILCCSVLDEYNKEFVPGKYAPLSNRITEFRRKIKPVLKRVSKWKDLKNFRNHILAHNLRVGDDSIFGYADKSLVYNTPSTISELKLLCELLSLITQNIGVEFPELEEQLNYAETIDDKLIFPTGEIDFDSEFKAVTEQIKVLGLTKTQQTDLSS